MPGHPKVDGLHPTETVYRAFRKLSQAGVSTRVSDGEKTEGRQSVPKNTVTMTAEAMS